jgi:phosphopentomutase
VRRRAAVVVIDACGVGALPDAAAYGDAGANTLAHVARAAGGLDLPTLQHLGLGDVLALDGVAPAPAPVFHGRLHPLGPGKDSTTGHWELMGVVLDAPLPTYPDGFPPAVIGALEHATGRRFCCGVPYDGLAVLEDFAGHHRATGELILYTSQDSVAQLAAHHDVLDEAGLYAACAAAREAIDVGRVIARPFTGTPGAYARTTGRRDLSLVPPTRSYLDALGDTGVAVHGVGKISDLFAGVGVGHHHAGATNAQALEATGALLAQLDGGLIFTNLVETDQRYGHRKDVDGFHAALRAIDAAVFGWLDILGEGDLLILCADHGCDPASDHTDHTREYVPLLAVWPGAPPVRHDGPMADVGASVLRWLTGDDDPSLPGDSFVG